MPSRMIRDVPTRDDPRNDSKDPHVHYSYDVRDIVEDDVELPPSKVIVPPSNKTLEAVTWPPAFSLSS